MNRRKLLALLGGTAGGASVIGTGAFTSIEAERTIEVQVADDANAFLGLEPSAGPNSEYATTTGSGQLELTFTQTDVGGQGVGTDSVYTFDDVFQVTNQGTQTVYVWATFDFSSVDFESDDVYLYPNGDQTEKLRDSDDEVLGLGVGESATIGVYMDTHDVTGGGTLPVTIHANADKPDASSAVDEAGDDFVVVTKNPTASNEYATIQGAIDAVTGSTVLVKPGTYAESVVVDKSVTLRSTDGPSATTIDARGKQRGVAVDSPGVVLEGFDIRGDTSTVSGVSIRTSNGATSDITLRNNRIRDIKGGGGGGDTDVSFGVLSYGTNPLSGLRVENNVVEDIGQSGTPGFGMQLEELKGSSPGEGAAIVGNTVRNLNGATETVANYGIGVQPLDDNSVGTDFPAGAKVANNTVENTAVALVSGDTTDPSSSVALKNAVDLETVGRERFFTGGPLGDIDITNNEGSNIPLSGKTPPFGKLPVDNAQFDGLTGPIVLKNIKGEKVVDTRPDGARFIIGLHASDIGSGQPYKRDSLIGVKPLKPGFSGSTGVPIAPTPFTKVTVDGKTVKFGTSGEGLKSKLGVFKSKLLDDSMDDITATLWHGPPGKLRPSGPILKSGTDPTAEGALIKSEATVTFSTSTSRGDVR